MKTFPIVVPCHFGLEAVLKREIIDLGYDIERVEDGRITFLGDAEARVFDTCSTLNSLQAAEMRCFFVKFS